MADGTEYTSSGRGEAKMAVQVTMYLHEDDQWERRSLHLQVLKYLREENVFGAVAYHAVAGFMGRMRLKTATLVDAGGKLPVVVSFVDTDEHVQRVMPRLKEMAAHRLIVRENVVVEQGDLD
jgi:PII-like signaling protein